jgi:hypothetical protein
MSALASASPTPPSSSSPRIRAPRSCSPISTASPGRWWTPTGPSASARCAAPLLAPGAPLLVLSGAASLDVWCGAYEAPSADGVEDYQPPEAIRVAFGAPAHGVAGFRSSHAEALQAAHIARLAPATAGPVTGYPRVELVSLLATDLPRARAFVARQLGPLASPDEPAERLRETVLAFLAAGGSATRVA